MAFLTIDQKHDGTWHDQPEDKSIERNRKKLKRPRFFHFPFPLNPRGLGRRGVELKIWLPLNLSLPTSLINTQTHHALHHYCPQQFIHSFNNSLIDNFSMTLLTLVILSQWQQGGKMQITYDYDNSMTMMITLMMISNMMAV